MALISGETGRMGKIHREVYDEFRGRDLSRYMSICTPDHTHGEAVIAALRAGRMVFCEKPVCTTRQQLDTIRELLTRGNGQLGCNFPLRFSTQFRKLKDLVEQDAFGTVYRVDATYHWGRRGKLDSTWRSEDPGYSYMLGGGVHMIDLIKWLFGKKMKPLGSGIENWAIQSGAITLEDGAICQVTADFGSDRGDHWHEVRIWGTKTCLTVRRSKYTEKGGTDKKSALRGFLQAEPIPTQAEILEVMETALILAGR